jgi:hypothetical protein
MELFHVVLVVLALLVCVIIAVCICSIRVGATYDEEFEADPDGFLLTPLKQAPKL